MHTPGPYRPDEILTLCVLAEVIVSHSFLVYIVACFDLHTCVNDGYQPDALCPHILYQLSQIRETLRIYSEILIPLHVVNVQVNAVKWNAGSLILLRHLPHVLLILITPAALTVAKCPEGRNVASADELSELLDNVFFVLTGDDVNCQVIFFCPDLHPIAVGIADVEFHSARIVEECAEGLPAADENEIVRTVQRTGVLLVVGIVGIPAYILPAPLVDTPDLLTQTIHNVLVLQRIGEGALAVGFKKGQLFSGWGNVRYHCVGGKGSSV